MPFTLGEKLERGSSLPEGEYVVTMAHWSRAEAQSGAPMIKVRWEVTEGDYAGDTIFDNFVITEKGIFRACQALRALGIPKETSFEDENEVINTLIRLLQDGKALKIKVAYRKGSTGREFANVVDYKPVDESETGSTVPF